MKIRILILLFSAVSVVAGSEPGERRFAGTENQQVTLRALATIQSYPDGIGNYIISAYDRDNPKELLFGLRMNNKKLEFVTVAGRKDSKPIYKGLTSKDDVPLDKEVYLCAVKTDNKLSVYINGTCQKQRKIVTKTPKANRLRVGAECKTGNTARDIKGKIKKAKVFKRAFTDREVAKDYSLIIGSDVKLITKPDGVYLPITIPAKPKDFPNAPTRVNLNLAYLEAFLPEGKYLNPVGVEVVKWDKKNEAVVAGKIDFRNEYDLSPKKMTIVWKRNETQAGDYAICFGRKINDSTQIKVIPLITGGEPLSVGRTDLSAQGQALAGYPVVLDYDGDGLNDLVISFVIPRRMLFYKNIGTKCKPVFKAPEMAFGGKSLLKFDMFQLPNGDIYAYSYKGKKINQWRAEDTAEGKTIEYQSGYSIAGLPDDVTVADILMDDANGDGVKDLLMAVFKGDWWWDGSDPWNKGKGNPNMGYGLGYDEKNKWYGSAPIGMVYLVINNGSNTEPKFSKAIPLTVDDQQIEIPTTQMAVALLDTNNDKKLDLLVGCGVDETLIFHNTSDDKNKLELSMPITAYRDSIVSKYSYFDQRFEVVDFDNNGDMEVLVGSNPGLTVLCEIEKGLLIEKEILEFKGANLWAETLVVPTITDLNCDGLWDVVTGDSSGFLSYFKNTGTNTEPIFATREKLKSDGKIFRPIAGYSGSIQGPDEARWGYLAPNVCDFDGDGKLDIVSSDITGYNYWLKNIAQEKGGYEFSEPQYLQIDTWNLKVRWRNRPAMWYADENLKKPSAIITSDEDGYMTLYERDFIKGPAALKKGKRLKLVNGKEIKLDGPSGYNGRSKFCTTDYNHDGKNDLLIGQPRRGFLHTGKRYDLSHEGYAYVAVLINEGTNKKPVFSPAFPLTLADGEKLYYGTHSCSPAAMDIDGDGYEEIFIGTERGFVRCYNRSLFENDSQIISIPGKTNSNK